MAYTNAFANVASEPSTSAAHSELVSYMLGDGSSGGSDTLLGGSGADTLLSGSGADTTPSGSGSDTVPSGSGNDPVEGSGSSMPDAGTTFITFTDGQNLMGGSTSDITFTDK